MAYDFSKELALRVDVDPRRNYRDEVDSVCPAWMPAQYKAVDGSSAAFADHPPKTPREVYDPQRGRTFAVPHQRYIRGIDPNGHICYVTISSHRPGPDRPDGIDSCGTEGRMRQEKQEAGWLFVEPGESFRGYSGEQYLAWSLAVREERRKVYEEKQRQMSAEFTSQAVSAIREQAKLQGETTAAMAKQIADSIIGAMTQVMGVKQSPAKRGE